MSPRFRLRAAEAADADPIAHLHVAAWRETFTDRLPVDFFSSEFIAGRGQMWRNILDSPAAGWAIVVAEAEEPANGGALIGFAAAGPPLPFEVDPPRPHHLAMLYLLAAHHGGGAGQALFDAVVGEKPAFLWTVDGEHRARRFYERNGFRPDGAHQVDPATGGMRQVRMVR